MRELKKFKNKYFEAELFCRLGSSDEKACKEVIGDNGYERYGLKIEEGDKWLDLGANCGAFAVYCGMRKIDCLSYEPDPQNFLMAQKNCEHNEVNHALMQKAVVPDSFEGESIKFFQNTDPGRFWRNSCVLKPKTKSVVEIQVEARKFSDAVKNSGCDCLKVDIEGIEIDIFMEKPSLDGVRKLALEWSFDYDSEIQKCKDVIEYLKGHFETVKCDKKFKEGETNWKHFPMNAMIFCY